MTTATMYDLSDIKDANRRAGLNWFSADTMRSFQCRIGSDVYQGPGGVYFVTSEKDRHQPNRPRAFTVRQFHPATGQIATVGPFNERTRSQAHTAAKWAAAHGVEGTAL